MIVVQNTYIHVYIYLHDIVEHVFMTKLIDPVYLSYLMNVKYKAVVLGRSFDQPLER